MSIDQYQTLTTNTGSMRGPDTANARNQGFVGEAFVTLDSNGNKKTPYSFSYEYGKYTLEITTQGDTSTASVVTIKAKRHDGSAINLATHHLRVRACADGAWANHGTATIAAGTGSTLIETITSNKDLVISNVAAASATGTLTISGVVADGETVVVGGLDNTQTYYFSTGLSSVPDGNVSVDISAAGTKAQGTLTVDTQPTAGDTMSLGNKVYTFRADGTSDQDGEIDIGSDLADAKLNIVAAINGTDGVNSPNGLVTASAFSSDDSVITAIVTGTHGNAITSTETFTAGTNVFDATTLGTTTAGVECSATDAGDALVTALAGDSLAEVSGVNASGTVTVTAVATGSSFNAVTTTETMANGAFGAGTLASGVTGNLDEFVVNVTNGSVGTTTLRIGAPPIGQNAGMLYDASLDVTHAAP